MLLEQRPDETDPETDDGVITPYQAPVAQFPEAIVKQVTHWLTMKFEGGETFRIDQLLELAEDEGMDRPMRRCLVLILFRSFSNSETEFKNMRAHITGSFYLDVAQGTNIEFTPKGGHQ